ncbi:hypothetical protein VNO77_29429 [Canavalia gladiata]|uniref:Uncharacterized protein n=1 Tax=Canavalia gladiata TaxID=3824 RepID=A0AAN9KWP0_CANGL
MLKLDPWVNGYLDWIISLVLRDRLQISDRIITIQKFLQRCDVTLWRMLTQPMALLISPSPRSLTIKLSRRPILYSGIDGVCVRTVKR